MPMPTDATSSLRTALASGTIYASWTDPQLLYIRIITMETDTRVSSPKLIAYTVACSGWIKPGARRLSEARRKEKLYAARGGGVRNTELKRR